jgi:hypothetical protein
VIAALGSPSPGSPLRPRLLQASAFNGPEASLDWEKGERIGRWSPRPSRRANLGFVLPVSNPFARLLAVGCLDWCAEGVNRYKFLG